MKEKRSFKRFDLLSALAVLGILLVLLFESIFIFELYNIRFEPLERLLQSVERPIPEGVDEPAPAADETPAPVETKEAAPAETEEPAPVG